MPIPIITQPNIVSLSLRKFISKNLIQLKIIYQNRATTNRTIN